MLRSPNAEPADSMFGLSRNLLGTFAKKQHKIELLDEPVQNSNNQKKEKPSSDPNRMSSEEVTVFFEEQRLVLTCLLPYDENPPDFRVLSPVFLLMPGQ